MEIKIVEERANPLMKRRELRFEVAHATAATPTRDTVRTELAKEVHAAKDRVIVERMRPRFGTAMTRGEANVYETADAAKSITREHILVRNGLKEKAAKGPAVATASPVAPPETPAPAEAKPEPVASKEAAAETKPAPSHHKEAAAEAKPPPTAHKETAAPAETPKKTKAAPKKE
jgi:small subunit ribosomal protein S24e